jgi:metal-sulfur cluster biosynthetic enzyme
MTTTEEVYNELRQVFDPEIPVNIVDLGLIYDVSVDGQKCDIKMTLTSQACPEARTIPEVMKRRVEDLDGMSECAIEIVWDPQWSPQLISPAGRQILGIEDTPPAEEAPAEASPTE